MDTLMFEINTLFENYNLSVLSGHLDNIVGNASDKESLNESLILLEEKENFFIKLKNIIVEAFKKLLEKIKRFLKK